ncbi:MAG: inositol monophosphatase family protein [Bacteroidota bacterium]
MDYKQITLQAITIVKSVRTFIKQELGKVDAQAIEEKSLNSLVSYVDRTAEEKLVDGLGKILPQATFLTEEETVEQQQSDLQWIIDPLDGTTNFLFSIPIFSVSVALKHNDELVVGIVHEVNQDESFYAWKSGGAYLNEKPIRVSQNTTLAEGLIATGFPYYDYSLMPKYFNALEALMQGTRGIRRLGSAAVDLAYVACGRFDAFYEYSLNIWDVAAGILLVREAGGRVSDFKGQKENLTGAEIVATSAQVYDPFFSIINKAFY